MLKPPSDCFWYGRVALANFPTPAYKRCWYNGHLWEYQEYWNWDLIPSTGEETQVRGSGLALWPWPCALPRTISVPMQLHSLLMLSASSYLHLLEHAHHFINILYSKCWLAKDLFLKVNHLANINSYNFQCGNHGCRGDSNHRGLPESIKDGQNAGFIKELKG